MFLDGKSALAWELLFPGHLSSTLRWGVPLNALLNDTTSELAGLFSTTSHKCRAPIREVTDTIPFFKVFQYESTREMNPKSTDCEAEALTTTPSCWSYYSVLCQSTIPKYSVLYQKPLDWRARFKH